MRIALVHRRFTTHGGTERFLVHLARFLSGAGHEVHVYSNSVQGDLRTSFTDISFHRLPMVKWGGALKVLSLCLSAHWLVPRRRFDVVQGFGRTLRQDVVRAGGGCHRVYYRMLLAEAGPLRRLMLRLSPKHRLTLWIERFEFRPENFERVVAVSHRVRGELTAELGVDPKRIEVIYNGVDLDRFHPDGRIRHRRAVREAHGVPESARVILFLGTGYRRKGLDAALRAFSQSAAPDRWMLVAGKDQSEGQYRKAAAGLGVGDRVVFCGPATEPERYYAAADAFVFPTRYEPFGNVCLEAMASGLPVITTKVNGATEIVPDELRELILDDPEDIDGLADRMKRLLSDPLLAGRLGEASRKAAAAFGWDENGRRMESLYRSIVSNKGGRRNEAA
jgi:UDP-glucose:(heptosyl)LPS alpha-1,3-glucosyltransferase